MRITKSFLIFNTLLIALNIIVGMSLEFAIWKENYEWLSIFSLTCWGIVIFFQISVFCRYLMQYTIQQQFNLFIKHKVFINTIIKPFTALILLLLLFIFKY